jgi:hypothetical protein
MGAVQPLQHQQPNKPTGEMTPYNNIFINHLFSYIFICQLFYLSTFVCENLSNSSYSEILQICGWVTAQEIGLGILG